MTLENLKNKILALLDVTEAPSESALCAAIDGVAKKVALYTKNIKKSATLTFTQEKGKAQADLPEDFAAFGYIRGERGVFAREQFEIVSGKIRTCRLGAGGHELIYFAYPPNVSAETGGDTELGFDDYTAHTVAYGVAMELCISICPEDLTRYARLATEYDVRMANLLGAARDAAGVANTFFAGSHF
ncbi:MAG: hypothetical protein IJX55_04030 [Clostridia bacterium]|nr:hypothetical protein [Clostridia bacterium]